MTRHFVLVLGVFFLIACASKKNASNTVSKKSEPAPNWITQKPVDSEYYYGIGASPITEDLSHIAIAKNRALADLASDVEVTISSNSILYVMERAYKLDEHFEEQIKVAVSEQFSNLEVVAVFENQVEYWVLYRANKADWLANKQAKKNIALEKTFAWYNQAKATNNFQQRYVLLAKAIDMLQPYWNERCMIKTEQDSIALDNAITSELRSLVTNIKIAAQNDLWLNFDNGFKTNAQLNSFCPINGNVLPVTNATFEINFIDQTVNIISDVNGKINYPIKVNNFNNQEGLLQVKPNLNPLTNEICSELTQQLLANITAPHFVFEWQVEPPAIYIETNPAFIPYATTLKQVLLEQGFTLSTSKKEANIILSGQVESSTNDNDSRYKVCYTSLVLSGRNLADNIIFSYSFNETKGVHLNIEEARNLSAEELKQQVENWKAQSLINKLTN